MIAMRSPWPGPLAEPWLAAGGRVASGRDMLLHQAVRQVRFFVSGQTESPLPDDLVWLLTLLRQDREAFVG